MPMSVTTSSTTSCICMSNVAMTPVYITALGLPTVLEWPILTHSVPGETHFVPEM